METIKVNKAEYQWVLTTKDTYNTAQLVWDHLTVIDAVKGSHLLKVEAHRVLDAYANDDNFFPMLNPDTNLYKQLNRCVRKARNKVDGPTFLLIYYGTPGIDVLRHKLSLCEAYMVPELIQDYIEGETGESLGPDGLSEFVIKYTAEEWSREWNGDMSAIIDDYYLQIYMGNEPVSGQPNTPSNENYGSGELANERIKWRNQIERLYSIQ